jgi:hypothetical protein
MIPAGGMTQMIEHQPSKHRVLSSNPSTTKNKKKRKKEYGIVNVLKKKDSYTSLLSDSPHLPSFHRAFSLQFVLPNLPVLAGVLLSPVLSFHLFFSKPS